MERLETERLVLEPLEVSHAERMVEVLADPALHRYLDNSAPPSLEQLKARYGRLQSRRSTDGKQLWLNWIVVPRGGQAAGFVQATVFDDRKAWVAYLLSREFWHRGYAAEATSAMTVHLAAHYGVVTCLAKAEVDNLASINLLHRLAFHPGTSTELARHELSSGERLFVKHLVEAPPQGKMP